MKAIIGSEFPAVVENFINQAQKSIDIIVFEWRYYPNEPGNIAQKFNEAIIQARRRGVKVRALVNFAHILNYLKLNDIEAKQLNDTKLLHCKLMIIDDKIAVVGSHNYTHAAFQINKELSIQFEITEETKDILNYFSTLWLR